MAYRHNQTVEVRGRKEGFLGSYYPATLLAAVGKSRYLVRYQTRYTEDKARPLAEAVDDTDIRPVPPKTQVPDFAVDDRVEAYVNGGWWVGRIARKVDPNYYVRLDGTGNEVHCAFYRVRVYLEWKDGDWVFPGNGSQNYHASEVKRNVSCEMIG